MTTQQTRHSYGLFLMSFFLLFGLSSYTQVYLVNEGFESTTPPPPGWVYTTGVTHSTAQARSGLRSARFEATNHSIRSPLLTTPEVLSFWLYRDPGGPLNVEVQWHTDPNATNWNTIANIQGSNNTWIQFTTDITSDPLITTNTNIYIRIRSNSGTRPFYIDDFTVGSTERVPDFIANLTEATTGQNIVFTDQSQGTISSWFWDFGNGAVPPSANTQGPHEVYYTSLGAKTVSLTINNTFTETKQDYIMVDEWLHWDDGNNFSAVGLTESGTFQIAKRFEPFDISAFTSHHITKIRVYISSMPVSASVKIWQGPNQTNLVEYVSQSFTPTANSWVVTDLNQPYFVDPSLELWFGVEIQDPGSGYFPAGIDEFTDQDGKGNLIRLDLNDPEAWTPLTTYEISGDWNLQAYLVPVAIVWTGIVSSEWNLENNWSTFSVPRPTSDVTIAASTHDPDISTDIVVNDIIIESGAAQYINPQSSLTINGIIDNQSGSSGLVIISSNTGTGSLIHNTNNVPATFQRYISREPEAWHLLSSPVSNQEISGDFTPIGGINPYGDSTRYDFYLWHEPDTSWIYLLNTEYPPTWAQAHPSSDFMTGQGYLVSYLDPNPTLAFSGLLHNGKVQIPVSHSGNTAAQFGANLVGNPFPSSVDWKADAGWNRSDLELSEGGYDIWIWNDTALNYGVYNSSSISDEGTLGVTRFIPPTQGFFVSASQSGNIILNNAARVHEGAGNWLKGISRFTQLLHIVAASGEGTGSDEVLIEFNKPHAEGGTVKKFSFVPQAPSLFIPRNGQFYSMQFLESPAKRPVMPLSFKVGKDGIYAFTFNFDPDFFEMIELHDLKTGVKQNLKDIPGYEFMAAANDEAGRFVLQFIPGHYANPHDALPVQIYTYNKVLYLDLQLLQGNYLFEAFDAGGRNIMRETLYGGVIYERRFQNSGLFITRISGTEGTLVKKIILF